MAIVTGTALQILDGSTVVMADTPRSQAASTQSASRRPGLGFPIARILMVFSLAVGTVLEAAIGPYPGKRTSERPAGRQESRGQPRKPRRYTRTEARKTAPRPSLMKVFKLLLQG